jgi:hypothetical protein
MNGLFNCCTDGVAPDWSLFAWLEVGGCTSETDQHTGDTWTNGGVADSAAEFWTVYGRLKEGGCEAITDCLTRVEAEAAAEEMREMSGLDIR